MSTLLMYVLMRTVYYSAVIFLFSVVKPGMADMRIIDSCCNRRPLLNVEALYGQLVVT